MLPELKITNVPQYPISDSAQTGIVKVIADLLRKKDTLSPEHTPHTTLQCGQLKAHMGDGA